MLPPTLFGLDLVRLMMALTNLTIVALVGLTMEWILVHTWPEQFPPRHQGSAWRPLYTIAGVTFVLAYFGTLWVMQAPRLVHTPLWQGLGLTGALLAGWTLWQMHGLLRPLPEKVNRPATR